MDDTVTVAGSTAEYSSRGQPEPVHLGLRMRRLICYPDYVRSVRPNLIHNQRFAFLSLAQTGHFHGNQPKKTFSLFCVHCEEKQNKTLNIPSLHPPVETYLCTVCPPSARPPLVLLRSAKSCFRRVEDPPQIVHRQADDLVHLPTSGSIDRANIWRWIEQVVVTVVP